MRPPRNKARPSTAGLAGAQHQGGAAHDPQLRLPGVSPDSLCHWGQRTAVPS